MATFLDKLLAATRKNGSLLCVGLDPDPALMPAGVDVASFNRAIIEATADLVCCYKPNMAFYEALGIPGLHALEETVRAIPSHIPILGDAKRGDMGNTAKAYAKALFDVWGFDAATVNAYQGRDAVEPFLERAEKGIFILVRTSNPGSADLQSLMVREQGTRNEGQAKGGHEEEGELLYQRVARNAEAWNERGNVGVVVGATAPAELQWVREHCPELPILIPGVGAQGGDLEASVRYGVDGHGERVLINSSRQVLYASRGKDFAEATRKAAISAREQMRQALPTPRR